MANPDSTFRRSSAAEGILFLIATAVPLALSLLNVFSPDGYVSFVRPPNAFRCLVGAQLFFFLLIWPLFVFGRGGAARQFASAALLGILSLPLILVAAAVTDVPVGAVARTQALLGCVVLCVIAFGRVGRGLERWYYLGAMLLSGTIPLAWYLVYDVVNVKLSWLAHVSPFWAMDEAAVPGGAWPLPMMILMACVAAALWFLKAQENDA